MKVPICCFVSSSVVKIHITAAFCCANAAGMCHWDTITNCSWKCLSATSLPKLATRKNPLQARDCFGDQNFLCCVSVFLIHCLAYLLPTGMVQGMAHLLVHEQELEFCRIVSFDCGCWMIEALVAGDESPRQDETEEPVWFTATVIKGKGKLVASGSSMPGCKKWWRVTALPPILSSLLPER